MASNPASTSSTSTGSITSLSSTSTTSTTTSTTSSTTTSSTTSTSSTSSTSSTTSTTSSSSTPVTSATSLNSATTSTTSSTTTGSTGSSSSTTTPLTSTTPTLSSTTLLTTGADGQTSTVVSVVTASNSAPASTSTSVAAASPKNDTAFFSNKGAVAGTFTAVGVVVAILAIILITSQIRRRRQKRFDREIDEAAREAAGAELPAFLDDDDEPKPYGATAYGGGGGYGPSGGYNSQGDWSSSGAGGGGVYSDTASHGTYAQAPMSHESYPMHDFGSTNNPGVGVGGIYDHSGAFAGGAAAAAGAAGIGRATGDPFGAVATGDSPYPAFLHPAGGYDNNGGVGPGGYPAMNHGNDVVAGGAAGMAGIGRRSSVNNALNRMKSQASAGALSGPSVGGSSTQQESYASHFTPGYPGSSAQDLLNRSTTNGSGPEATAAAAGTGFTAGGANFSSAVHDAAFGGQEEQSALPNPFTSRMESEDDHEGEEAEDPYSGYGSEDEEQPKKVLKVANE